MTVERFPIEAGHIMMFARAIGDDNPVYYDEALAARSEVGGIIAPPTFVQASAQYDPDYPLRPHTGVVWHGSGRSPSGRDSTSIATGAGGGTSLHAEQHYEYHRPLRPGDVLGSGTVGTGCILESPEQLWLQPGDVVEVEADNIGLLRNGVIDETE